MAVARKNYVISAGGAQFLVKLPSTYDSINTLVGLTSAPDNSTALSVKDVKFLYANGLATKIRITRKVGTRYLSTNILCDLEKLPSALAGLEGKQFGAGTTAGAGEIISAGFGSRRRLG